MVPFNIYDSNYIVVNNNLNHFSIPLLVAIVFVAIILYLYISIYNDRRYKEKLKKAETMIREGHDKALNGKKDDGFYSEEKHLRT